MAEETKALKPAGGRAILVFIACCILMGIGFAFPTPVFSIFWTPIQKSLGLSSIAPIALYTTFVSAGNIISALTSPTILRKGGRFAVAAAGAVMGLGYIALAVAPSLPLLYVAGFLAGFCSPLVSFIMVPIVISNWFEKNQGTFMGITMAMTGIFGAVFTPVFTNIMGPSGDWTRAVMIMGVSALIVIVLLALLVIHITPQEVGLLPYGASADGQAAAQTEGAAAGEKPGLEVSQGLKSAAFWIIAIAMFLIGALGSMLQQLSTASIQAGYDQGAASTALAIAMVGVIFGNIIAGVIKDKSSTAVSVGVNCALGFVGFILVIVALIGAPSATGALTGGCALFGFSMSLGTVAPSLICGDAFGPKNYDNFLGISTAVVDCGTAIAAIVLSAVADATGGYFTSIVGLMVGLVIIAICVAVGVKAGSKLWKAQA